MTENIYFDEEVGNLEMQQCVRNAAPVGGGIIDVEDVAGTAVFLASDEAKSITGQILTIDGGRGVIPDEAFMTKLSKPYWMKK